MAEPVPHWPGRMVGPVHVRSTPEGAPEQAVFVHGLAGSATNWTDLMQRAEGRGHRARHRPARSRVLARAARRRLHASPRTPRAVIGFLERIGPAHLFGNSMGGAISVRVAATRPDLVRSLTLISPALPDLLPRYGPVRVAAAAMPRLGEWVADRLRLLPAEQRVNASFGMVWADAARGPPGAAARRGGGAAPARRPAARRRRDDRLGPRHRGRVLPPWRGQPVAAGGAGPGAHPDHPRPARPAGQARHGREGAPRVPRRSGWCCCPARGTWR